VFFTDLPRESWLVSTGSLEASDFCLCVDAGQAAFNVYPLHQVKECDLCRLIL